MAGTHGDLFSEIGSLVLAAHGGRAIDIVATAEDLSQRYRNLGLAPDTMARAIARSLGAVGVSLARYYTPETEKPEPGPSTDEAPEVTGDPSALFPSGVRLALLS